MKQYQTVIFDLDGTLLDTLADLKSAVNYALSSHNMPKRSLDEVREFVGNGIRRLMERAVPKGTDAEVFEQVFASFQAYYKEHCNDETKPYAGVTELLAKLKAAGYRLAIVSNKADYAVKELWQLYFADTVESAIGEMEGIRRKPAPDTVYQAEKELGVTGERAVYVGDSEVDIETAANAGLPCISVTWGFREKEFLLQHGGTQFAENVQELCSLLGADTNL